MHENRSIAMFQNNTNNNLDSTQEQQSQTSSLDKSEKDSSTDVINIIYLRLITTDPINDMSIFK